MRLLAILPLLLAFSCKQPTGKASKDSLEESLSSSGHYLAIAKSELLFSVQHDAQQTLSYEKVDHFYTLIKTTDLLGNGVNDSLRLWSTQGWERAAEISRRTNFLKTFVANLRAIHPVLQREMTGIDLLTGSIRKESYDWQNLRRYVGSISAERRKLLISQIRLNIQGVVYYAQLLLRAQLGGGCNLTHHEFSALVTQNAEVVKPGAEVTIRAGVGSFSAAALPGIYVNRQKVDVGLDLQARYRVRAAAKPGIYSIPVEIRFVDLDGIQRRVTKNVTYEVIDCPSLR
ncbi:MAG: hypothetical protein EOO15_15120 [Chitinophagaceae bacterium]|nr:MAG: hypothetical protein EOO15_15120 [Chitinophagaceae bacterium]